MDELQKIEATFTDDLGNTYKVESFRSIGAALAFVVGELNAVDFNLSRNEWVAAAATEQDRDARMRWLESCDRMIPRLVNEASEEAINAFHKGMGARIRKYRQAAKLRQIDIAAAIGLTRTSAVNIEKGIQRISAHTMVLIANRIEVSVEKLIP